MVVYRLSKREFSKLKNKTRQWNRPGRFILLLGKIKIKNKNNRIDISLCKFDGHP